MSAIAADTRKIPVVQKVQDQPQAVVLEEPWFKKLFGGHWHRFPCCWVGEVDYTADMALEVLTHRNTHNRPKVPSQIDLILRALNLDVYLFSGETIIFDDQGVLLNGQNRSHAVLESGKPMHTLVVCGVSREVFKVLDQHSRRRMSHVLGMMDVKYAAAVAGAINFIHYLLSAGTIGKAGSGSVLTNDERLKILERHPGLPEAGQGVLARRGFKVPIQSSGLILFLNYLFSALDAELALAFWQELAGKRSLPDACGYSMVELLRSRLNENRASRAKMSIENVGALAIKAWNFLVLGQERQQLTWKPGGGEAFPLPEGWAVEQKGGVKELAFRRPHNYKPVLQQAGKDSP